MITKHYTQFFYPGLIVEESSTHESTHRDPHKLIADGELPDGAASFLFFDRKFIGATTDDGARIEHPQGGPDNHSPRYYPEAQLLDRAGVEALDRDTTIALRNMRSNKIDRVVQTRRGTLQPFDSKAMVLL